ncbi:hypothetical protein GLP22_17940 [Photobacterium carnosum]|uniref:hypothetical protein n=1 Tax=Photobacterium carnosum TaxID=2023717 RepID=UPI001E5088F0|nr:hypothetical protein [Photobacterium carnosum]MCD9537772.1 hypothetical protein [Photobacterium carnosum]MCD9543064.1 hypothetical protein [Photobacterium carnosum]MCF2162318.1 hypothetical protein [Photobacterium carnosum]
MKKKQKWADQFNLKRDYYNIFEQRLRDDFQLETSSIQDYKNEISPIIYTSILNKLVKPKPRKIVLSDAFHVPENRLRDWDIVKREIESGANLEKFLSKDAVNWNKADFFLFTFGIYHMHLTSKNGVGTNKELLYFVLKEDVLYMILCGDHSELYSPAELIDIAENNWPKKLFNLSELKNNEYFYTKRLANDPDSHFNLINPAGRLAGVQHSLITSLPQDELKNVPYKTISSYNKEVEYLEKLENELVRKYGGDIELKLDIDFDKRQYIVRVLRDFSIPLYVPFLDESTCSSWLADHCL